MLHYHIVVFRIHTECAIKFFRIIMLLYRRMRDEKKKKNRKIYYESSFE
jgi:hypothetical protein